MRKLVVIAAVVSIQRLKTCHALQQRASELCARLVRHGRAIAVEQDLWIALDELIEERGHERRVPCGDLSERPRNAT